MRRPGVLSPSSPPPWDAWDLDPAFFAALSRWTAAHPESTLDRVLEKICIGIDNGKDLLVLVPDSPFPARGLLGALAYLVKLGAVSRFSSLLAVVDVFLWGWGRQTISKATLDVRAFSKEIVDWVDGVRSAFERDDGGCSTKTTRKNLREMRCV